MRGVVKRKTPKRRPPEDVLSDRVGDAVRAVERAGELADPYSEFLELVIDELRIRLEGARGEEAEPCP